MAKALTAGKVTVRPEDIAAAVISGLANGAEEILADDRAREIATNFVNESNNREKLDQQAWDESSYSKQ